MKKKMGNYRLFSHRYNNNHSISYLLDRKRKMDSLTSTFLTNKTIKIIIAILLLITLIITLYFNLI